MRKITAKSGLWFLLIIPIVMYVGWVINYEVNLGRNQPMRGNSIIIATYDDQDARHERVLSLGSWAMNYMFQQIIGREPGIGKPYKTRM